MSGQSWAPAIINPLEIQQLCDTAAEWPFFLLLRHSFQHIIVRLIRLHKAFHFPADTCVCYVLFVRLYCCWDTLACVMFSLWDCFAVGTPAKHRVLFSADLVKHRWFVVPFFTFRSFFPGIFFSNDSELRWKQPPNVMVFGDLWLPSETLVRITSIELAFAPLNYCTEAPGNR